MIDMHTHILPGIDDGPKSMEESIKMIAKGIAEGIKTFVLTPHLINDSDWNRYSDIIAAFDSLNAECAQRGLNARLLLGSEAFLCESLPDKLKENKWGTINGKGSYVLIELPFTQLPVYAEDVLFNLLVNRYIPVIAHPERYLYIGKKNFKILEKWADNGILFQINTGSLNKRYGVEVKKNTKLLISENMAHCFGSDVHSVRDGFFFEMIKNSFYYREIPGI